jgi:hypothetical protein
VAKYLVLPQIVVDFLFKATANVDNVGEGGNMSKTIANPPGIGGSLGQCVLCGQTFLEEILRRREVPIIEIEGMSKYVCIHTKCLKVLEANGSDWRTLPDGPLRRAYEEATNAQEKKDDEGADQASASGRAEDDPVREGAGSQPVGGDNRGRDEEGS